MGKNSIRYYYIPCDFEILSSRVEEARAGQLQATTGRHVSFTNEELRK